MTISGFFLPSDRSKTPFVFGTVQLGRLGAQKDVTFVIDTGAEASVLCYADRIEFVPEGTSFESVAGTLGSGGPAPYAVDPAVVLLTDDLRGPYGQALLILVAMDPERSVALSLLGRDYLQHVVLHMDLSRSEVTLEPL